MANVSDNFKDIFLAGIGALALGGEKSKEIVSQLIEKGEMTVDQGKQINTELKHKASEVSEKARYDMVEMRMAAMSAEERTEFAERVAQIAAEKNAEAAAKEAEATVEAVVEEVTDNAEGAEAAAEDAASEAVEVTDTTADADKPLS